VAGVDIGAVATKAVVISDGEVIAYNILPTGLDLERVAKRALKKASIDAGFNPKDMRALPLQPESIVCALFFFRI